MRVIAITRSRPRMRKGADVAIKVKLDRKAREIAAEIKRSVKNYDEALQVLERVGRLLARAFLRGRRSKAGGSLSDDERK